MSWLSSAYHWMAALDASKVGGWATAASVVISGAALGAAVWLGALTRILARETKLAREASERADVQCAVETSERTIQLLELIIINVGKASAKDVIVQVERGGKFYNTERPTFQFSIILPGKSIRVFVGSYLDMKEKVFAVKITYKDSFGVHPFSYEQDLTQWKYISQAGSPSNSVIADSLKTISETINGWSGIKRLKVETFSKEDREAEAARWVAYEEELSKKSTPNS